MFAKSKLYHSNKIKFEQLMRKLRHENLDDNHAIDKD